METEPNEARIEDPNDETLEDPAEQVDDGGDDAVVGDDESAGEDEAPAGP